MFITTFTALFIKIIPLYCLIILGYLVGKFGKIDGSQMAKVLIYIIMPIVVFDGTLRAQLDFSVFSLPILFFILACFSCGIFYLLGSKIWTGSEKNIIAYGAGTGNTGYFGLPVAMSIFGEKIVPVMVVAIFGFMIYEATLGVFVTLRGKYTIADSLKRLIKFPVLYTFTLGLILNIYGVKFGANYFSLIYKFQGAYTVIGMMLIGIGVSQLSSFKFDFKFIGMGLLARFIFWPLITVLIIIVDKLFFHIYSEQIYIVMLLIATVPMAANSVAFATLFNIHPEKVALTVALSTLFSLLIIPFALSFLL